MLSNLNYSWQRRWLPINDAAGDFEAPYQLDETGYVSLQRWRFREEAEWVGVALADLTEQHRCVVLLGEPGIGKSREWEKQQSDFQDNPRHLFLDLGTVGSEEELRHAVHEATQTVTWKSGDGTLNLWLDSLDEGLLHVSTLQHALLRVLAAHSLPLHRLCLRILCRNAVWPVAFSEALGKLLRLPIPLIEPAFLTMLLSPLSRDQVAEAATAESFDADDFLAAVTAADAQPLAGRPVTLSLLIELYRAYGPGFGLTETAGRAGIYERGCLELCERPDRERPDHARPDAKSRLLLAGYVAMLSVLTNRRVLLAEPAVGTLLANELDVYALSGGNTASWRGHAVPSTIPALRDVFKHTGLFTNLGAGGRLVWAHQSYAEFLAAWYLNLTDLSVAALRPLFRSAADPAGGIVPALHETAAWLADLRPAFWQEMLVLDPLALLQADLRRLSPERRAMVVNRLVQWVSGLAYLPYQNSTFLAHLAHPDLASQLTPLLDDPSTPSSVLLFATDLARATKVEGLQQLLVAQALDDALPLRVRNRALYILREIADADACAQLRPLRLLIPHNDESDELRGHLLAILWPNHLTADELLPMLTRRKNNRLFGAYHHFVYDLDKDRLTLTRATLLASLRWITQHTPQWSDNEESFWRETAHHLQARAWELSDDPEMAEALVEAIVAAEADHQPFRVGGTREQRMAVLERLLHHPRRTEYLPFTDGFLPGTSTPTLVDAEDWSFVYSLLDSRLKASAREWVAQILKQLLSFQLNRNDPDYTIRYEELHQAARRFPSVKNAFAPWCTATNLDDERVIRNQKFRERNRLQAKRKHRERHCRRLITLHHLATTRRDICRILLKGAAAQFFHWHGLAQRIATVKVKGGYRTHHDVTASSRWRCLTPAQQEQAADIAQAVLAAHPVLPADWFTPGYNLTTGADSLHSALLLCQHQRPAYLAQLPVTFWQSWAACLVQYRFYEDSENLFGVLAHAAAAAPAAVNQAIVGLAEAASNRREAGLSNFARFYQALPEAGFAALLLQGIQTGAWHEEFSAALLVEMLKAGYQPALTYTECLIPEPAGAHTSLCARPTLVSASYKWLLFDRERQSADSWPHWLRLSSQPQLAFSLINEAIYHPSPRELQHLALLDEGQLEALLLWLTYAFNLAPDDVDDWGNRPNGRVAALRTAVAVELATRGTATAWQMLLAFASQQGHPHWLRLRLDQVRENLRRNAWEPLPPDALATLSREADRRWVRSAADLQDILLESLDRFQADLQGEPTTAEVLWVPTSSSDHKSRKTGHEVREENFLSNIIRQHFRQDLQRSNVLVKREVEIRPSLGKGTGQRTDLFVEAFSRNVAGDKIDVVTVVVEVKLSRNDESETGLNTQLTGYLADQHYKHGIFLVGWHYGQYDPKPPRKKSQDELMSLLLQQAAAVAPAFSIKARVLDIRLPADSGRQQLPPI